MYLNTGKGFSVFFKEFLLQYLLIIDRCMTKIRSKNDDGFTLPAKYCA